MIGRIVCCLVALLCGCATSPVPYSQAKSVPVHRIAASELTQPFDGAGRLSVSRDSGLMGAACSFSVYLDGKLVASLIGSEKIDMYVQPGEHTLGAAPNGICGGGTAETSAAVTASQWRRFRISSGQDGTIALSPTAF